MTLTEVETLDLEPLVRTCRLCGHEGPEGDFCKSTKSWCIPCNKERQKVYQARWRAKNPEKVREYKRNHARRYYARNKEAKQEYWRSYRRKNPDVSLRSGLKYRYGLSLDQFREMESRQAGLCLACGRRPKSPLVIDHCHDTGEVRGLLCRGCNTALGLTAEDPKILRGLATYLEEKPWQS